MNSIKGIFILLAIGLGILIFLLIRHNMKSLKIGSVTLFSGGVKKGKTNLSVHFARKKIRSNIFKWYLSVPFCLIFRKPIPKKPMLYSNIPLRWIRFNRFTKEILFREVRIPDKSVVLIDEASLLADSMLFKNQEVNNRLMLFVKLFGHYTHGGSLIINTQSLSDLHFSFKRCISNYIYIYECQKYPFITRFKVREMMYSEDNSNVNTFEEDIELSMRNCFVFNKVYKMYDQYALSIFTDDLDYQVDYDCEILGKYDSLKVKELVSLQDFARILNSKFDSDDTDEVEDTEQSIELESDSIDDESEDSIDEEDLR